MEKTIQWKKVLIQGKQSPALSFHSCVLHENTIILFGGWGKKHRFNKFHRIFKINIENFHGEWKTATGDIPEPRRAYTTTQLDGDGTRALIFGGNDFQGMYRSDAYLLNLESLEWEKISSNGDIPHERAGHTITAMNETLFMFGGKTKRYQLFNDLFSCQVSLETNEIHWQDLKMAEPKPPPRYGHSASLVGSHLWIFGGSAKSREKIHNDLWAFDLEYGFWIEVEWNLESPYPSPRYYHSAISVSPHHIVIFGGCNDIVSPQDLNDVWMFNTQTMEWHEVEYTEVSQKPEPRHGHQMCVSSARAFMHGGWNYEYVSNEFWMLDMGDGVIGSMEAQKNYLYDQIDELSSEVKRSHRKLELHSKQESNLARAIQEICKQKIRMINYFVKVPSKSVRDIICNSMKSSLQVNNFNNDEKINNTEELNPKKLIEEYSYEEKQIYLFESFYDHSNHQICGSGRNTPNVSLSMSSRSLGEIIRSSSTTPIPLLPNSDDSYILTLFIPYEASLKERFYQLQQISHPNISSPICVQKGKMNEEYENFVKNDYIGEEALQIVFKETTSNLEDMIEQETILNEMAILLIILQIAKAILHLINNGKIIYELNSKEILCDSNTFHIQVVPISLEEMNEEIEMTVVQSLYQHMKKLRDMAGAMEFEQEFNVLMTMLENDEESVAEKLKKLIRVIGFILFWNDSKILELDEDQIEEKSGDDDTISISMNHACAVALTETDPLVNEETRFVEIEHAIEFFEHLDSNVLKTIKNVLSC